MNELTPMEAAKQQLRQCDEMNRRYGLTLTEAEITELAVLRGEALRATGRVEFGGGILPKLMKAFCKSPYVDNGNYAAVLADLQEAFYYFKNECEDRFSDDDLIEFMEQIFNGVAEGSAELLCSISLEDLCRWARNPELYQNEEAQWV